MKQILLENKYILESELQWDVLTEGLIEDVSTKTKKIKLDIANKLGKGKRYISNVTKIASHHSSRIVNSLSKGDLSKAKSQVKDFKEDIKNFVDENDIDARLAGNEKRALYQFLIFYFSNIILAFIFPGSAEDMALEARDVRMRELITFLIIVPIISQIGVNTGVETKAPWLTAYSKAYMDYFDSYLLQRGVNQLGGDVELGTKEYLKHPRWFLDGLIGIGMAYLSTFLQKFVFDKLNKYVDEESKDKEKIKKRNSRIALACGILLEVAWNTFIIFFKDKLTGK